MGVRREKTRNRQAGETQSPNRGSRDRPGLHIGLNTASDCSATRCCRQNLLVPNGLLWHRHGGSRHLPNAMCPNAAILPRDSKYDSRVNLLSDYAIKQKVSYNSMAQNILRTYTVECRVSTVGITIMIWEFSPVAHNVT